MRHPVTLRTAVALAAALLHGACVSTPALREPSEISSPEAFKAPRAADTVALEERWWEAFEDPVLNRLVDKAEQGSPDLEQALAQLERAVAVAGIQGATLYPHLELLVSASRSRQSASAGGAINPGATRNRFLTSLQLDWELDARGRVRHLRRAAEFEAEAAAQAYGYALTVLRSQIAQQYFLLRGADRRIGILEATIGIREGALNLVRIRQESGISDELELAQATTEVANARADLERARGERAASENALATLTGQMASAFSLEPKLEYSAPASAPPEAVAADLLRRRPDVAEALELVQAASERVGAEVAAFFPSIRLTGDFGYAAGDTGDWFRDPSRLWSLAPSVNLPLFQGRERQQRLALAEAEYRSLFAAFHRQALVAIEEVETSLAVLRQLSREKEALEQASTAASRAAALARERYESGMVSYLEVVDTERAALTAALRYSQIEMEQLVRMARLAAELGGAWQAAPSP